MKVQSILRVLAASTLVGLTACGGGGGGSADLTRTPVATTLSLNDNSFSFANFSAKKSTEEFGADDLVAMFGASADVCTGGKEPCVPTPEAAAFARMVNQARSSGHCEGLVALAASRFVEKVTPPTGELQKDPDVVHAILRAFATQFLPESQKETNGWAKKSIETVLAAIQENLAKDRPEYTLNLYTDNGGHAVLPVAIDFPDNDTAVVHVYDSNWPDKDRFVTFDLKKKEWSFSFSGKDPANDPKIWSGGKGDIDLTSLTSRTTSSCPFCGEGTAVRNTLLVIRSIDKKIEITTDEGTVSPDKPSAGETFIKPLAGPGAEPAEGEPRDYIVSVPSGNKSTKIKAGSEARIVAVTPDAITEAVTPKSGSTASIEITPFNISVTDPNVELTLAAGNFVITASGENNTITKGDGSISVTVDGADGSPVTLETTLDRPALQVLAAGSESLPEGAAYVVTEPNADGGLDVTSYAPDGTTSTSKTDGELASTSTSVALAAPLASTEEVPGLPPESERAGDTVTSSTTSSTSSTVAPVTTEADSTDSGSTKTPKTTVKPKTTATTAPASTARTTVSVGVNLDQWPYGANDAASTGFSATLAISGGDSQNCASAVCLEGMVVDGASSGTDPATGRTVTTTATFTMKSVTVPFSVRCGTAGSWVSAGASGGLYSASCTIDSVKEDEVIYLRA